MAHNRQIGAIDHRVSVVDRPAVADRTDQDLLLLGMGVVSRPLVTPVRLAFDPTVAPVTHAFGPHDDVVPERVASQACLAQGVQPWSASELVDHRTVVEHVAVDLAKRTGPSAQAKTPGRVLLA